MFVFCKNYNYYVQLFRNFSWHVDTKTFEKLLTKNQLKLIGLQITHLNQPPVTFSNFCQNVAKHVSNFQGKTTKLFFNHFEY